MSRDDLKVHLESAIAERNDAKGKGGAAKVARLLGICDAALSQYRKGVYPAPDTIDQRIREIIAQETVTCPELGEIPLADCSGHKKRKPTTDSFYARMFRACQKCDRRSA